MPALDRQEHAQRYAPLPAPLFEAPDRQEFNRLAVLLPTERAKAALQALDVLSESRLGHPPGQMSMLAELMTTDKRVRDFVIVHAAKEPAKVSTLVETYRAAPKHMRSDLRASAAAAMHFAGMDTGRIRAVLEHVDENQSLGQLVRSSLTQDLPMDDAAEIGAPQTEQLLREGDVASRERYAFASGDGLRSVRLADLRQREVVPHDRVRETQPRLETADNTGSHVPAYRRLSVTGQASPRPSPRRNYGPLDPQTTPAGGDLTAWREGITWHGYGKRPVSCGSYRDRLDEAHTS